MIDKSEHKIKLPMGQLFVIATPIGNLCDISLRALDVLRNVDKIAVEDTRHSRHLCQKYQITTPLVTLHQHNEQHKASSLIQDLQGGQSIALISDAGTPLISDPGYHLVNLAHQAGIVVIPIPGANAAITALSAAGLAADRFQFMGFLSAKENTRRQQLKALQHYPHTLIFYEAPHRIFACLQTMQQVFGQHRQIVLAKELTKCNETFYQGECHAALTWLAAEPMRKKGEFVILVKACSKQDIATQAARQAQTILNILMSELPLAQAAKLTAKITGVKKNMLYRCGLANLQ